MGYLDSFAAVQDKYLKTKPVVSKNWSKHDDLRPVGNRRRTNERIIKGGGDSKYTIHGAGASITWEQDPHGDTRDYVTIRNHGQTPVATNFLVAYLPLGIAWVPSKKIIHVYNGEPTFDTTRGWSPETSKYYLPPTYTDELDIRDPIKPATLTFARQDHGVWSITGRTYSRPRTLVDHVKKAEYKPHIDAFWAWLCAVGPLLPKTYGGRRAYVSKLYVIPVDMIRGSKWGAQPTYVTDRRLAALQIMSPETEEQEELRMAVACDFLQSLSTQSIDDITTQKELSALRNKFNSWVNRNCGLVTQIPPRSIDT